MTDPGLGIRRSRRGRKVASPACGCRVAVDALHPVAGGTPAHRRRLGRGRAVLTSPPCARGQVVPRAKGADRKMRHARLGASPKIISWVAGCCRHSSSKSTPMTDRPSVEGRRSGKPDSAWRCTRRGQHRGRRAALQQHGRRGPRTDAAGAPRAALRQGAAGRTEMVNGSRCEPSPARYNRLKRISRSVRVLTPRPARSLVA
jgi:hypothetical protein